MACPVREIAWDKTGQQVIHPCKRRVTENGFCQEHQLSHEFLCIGARIGYPEVKVPFKWKRDTLYRTIHRGASLWEDAATDPRRLADAMDFIEGEYADILQEAVTAKG